MIIRFLRVAPHPLADSPLHADSVWQQEVTVSSNNCYLIQAPSGTGKTTLVSLVYGLRNDYDGQIEFDGQNIRQLSISGWTELRRRKLAIVFQDLRLFPQFTAFENIQVKNNLTGTLTDQEIRSMADRLGIAGRLQQKCGTLSLGQQQRVAILRALAQPFELLLLDEPFSHLDQNNAEIASALIKENCSRYNAGLILTSLGTTTTFNFTANLII